ncbi:hypothetical protein BD309DRAFT_989187 [Dichomitus squalens]|nr:hypothetical protein BD309DRAFT_989187 [Dichomitus squalens]
MGFGALKTLGASLSPRRVRAEEPTTPRKKALRNLFRASPRQTRTDHPSPPPFAPVPPIQWDNTLFQPEDSIPSSDQSAPVPAKRKAWVEDDVESEAEEPGEEDGIDVSYHLPSTRCAKYLDEGHAMRARDLWDELEEPPSSLVACPSCAAPLTTNPPELRTLFRCKDCAPLAMRCAQCMCRSHCERPYNRILQWDLDKRIWTKIALPQIGYELRLGHGGALCGKSLSKASNLVVLHEHGIMDLPVVYCACEGSGSEVEQLMRAGLWPATWERPHTATSLTALEAFHSLNLNGQVNVHDYLAHLKRQTDNVCAEDVKDRYREFNNSYRLFTFVRACRRAGVDPTRLLNIGCLAVLCPACPQPGKNIRPGWEDRDPAFQYLDALHYSIDGNFHFNLKLKHTDPKDFPLTKGAAYFVHEDDFKKYIAQAPRPKYESSTCNEFAAMGSGKYKGPVSGIIAVVCRHMMVMQGGVVDLTKAEGYMYVDIAMVSSLQRYLKLKLLIGSYDIHCQYIIHLRERLETEFPKEMLDELESIDDPDVPTIIAAVGKYHLSMHKPACRPYFSLHHLPGSCMDCGETCERLWGIISGVSRRTKEMSSGHRHDALNDLFSDHNVRRIHHITTELYDKLEIAEERLATTTEYLQTVEASVNDRFPLGTLAEWQDAHAQWNRDVVDITKHKVLESPFEPPTDISE